MARNEVGPYTQGVPSFDPETLFKNEDLLNEVDTHLKGNNNLRSATIAAFGLPVGDSYIYHANASVNLAQVQHAIDAGSAGGLHDWYRNEDGSSAGHPPSSDIAAYTSIFDPRKSAANTLKSFAANAKRNSIRLSVATHLLAKRHLDISIVIPKRKAPHENPYLTFWVWSCNALEYAGPNLQSANVKISHHVLPIFMHHFGCACPSYEALEIISRVAAKRTILDIGSGNGYWTFMLRRHGCTVIPVDNQQSRFRTCWIGDTYVGDGVQALKMREGAKDDVLLMVYPIVSGDFTEKVFESFNGDVICVVGTQNGNGYTGFKDATVDQWMEANRNAFEKIAQVPLPSFAGKDDALFVFRKSEVRRPSLAGGGPEAEA